MAAPLAGTQAPAFYRHKVGSYEVTVISDGNLTLDATMFTGDEAGAEKLLRDAHLPKTGFITPINVWLINTGQKLILVDAGGGTHFAPSIGRLPQNLAAAGISPAAIDAVVITHPHPDHIPGVITSDHKMLFPNATLHVNENDHSFWTSADIRGKAPEEFRGFFDLAVNAIKPYAAAGKLLPDGLCGAKTASHVHAAVHAQRLPGDVAGLVRAEEDDGRGDLLGAADAAERDALEQLLAGGAGDRGGHVSLDESR